VSRALLLVLVGCAASPPAASGSSPWTSLREGKETIQVYRDSYGVPHLFAETLHGAFWAQGYLQAQDRPMQMEMFRRAAQGEAAEILGPRARANDRDRLRRGYTPEELGALFDQCETRTREIFEAYAQGINAGLEKRGVRPGGEGRDGRTLRPWKATDSVAIAVMMARRFGEAGQSELVVGRVQDELSRKVGAEEAKLILSDVLRVGDPWAPTTLGDEEKEPLKAPAEKGWIPAPAMSDLAFGAYQGELAEIFRSREWLGVPSSFGSNAWAVAPARSASGHALLYGGPMMGWGTPSVCSEVHLVGPGLAAAGMSFPGVPGVMIGWNERLAWTTTSGDADLVDVYVLELDPEDPGRYRYRGEWRKFEILDREIRILGERSEKLRVYRSVYGPLVGEPDLKSHRAYSLRMAFWMKESGTIDALMDINFARTLEEFQGALSRITTSHNFFCATGDGHIGFWYCGAHPVRKKGHDGTAPAIGDGTMDWEGFLPFKDWPQAIDPVQGYFGNWNNKPSRGWPSVGQGRIFGGKKITDVLSWEPKVSLARMKEIARLTAYHAYLADYFVPILLEAAPRSDDPEVKRAAQLLGSWDHMKIEGTPGPEILERWLRAAERRVFGELADPLVQVCREVEGNLADTLLGALGPGKPGRPNRFDYLRGQDREKIILDSLREAVQPGVGDLGWKEPSVDFKGDVGAVKSERGRGTYQMAVEMAPEGPRASTLLAPGQSEQPDSPHHKDQMGLFGAWDYKPFVFRREDLR
jgi:penicillin amidase